MPKYLEIVNEREKEIANVIEILQEKSLGLRKPKLILIGGYGLRAFVPFSRATRDCDFVVEHSSNKWNLEIVRACMEKALEVEAFEIRDTYGFLRMIKLLKHLGKIKISLDFFEGEVRGREEDDIVKLDKKFFDNAKKVEIQIEAKKYKMLVPNYVDYLVLKIISARPSDIRDIAALLWKNNIPRNIKSRMKELVDNKILVERKLKKIIEDISNENFVDSWRGTFALKDFGEKERKVILKVLKKIF